MSAKVTQMNNTGDATAPVRLEAADVPAPAPLTADRGRLGGFLAVLAGLASAIYILLAAGCASFLIFQAYMSGAAASDFTKLALAAVIAVIGAGLTASAAVYGATRQSATAYQVQLLSADANRLLAQYNAAITTKLAAMKTDADEALATLKANSDEALARLKVGLDAGQTAHRELFGVATIYFYALRSIAYGQWSDETIKMAEDAMISATRHLLYVGDDVRTAWYDFWQRAQEIRREAAAEADATKRPEMVGKLIEKDVRIGRSNTNLRALHVKLENIARAAATEAIAVETA
jgi:hypothetical protein